MFIWYENVCNIHSIRISNSANKKMCCRFGHGKWSEDQLFVAVGHKLVPIICITYDWNPVICNKSPISLNFITTPKDMVYHITRFNQHHHIWFISYIVLCVCIVDLDCPSE